MGAEATKNRAAREARAKGENGGRARPGRPSALTQGGPRDGRGSALAGLPDRGGRCDRCAGARHLLLATDDKMAVTLSPDERHPRCEAARSNDPRYSLKRTKAAA
jgi:hypothetical protein